MSQNQNFFDLHPDYMDGVIQNIIEAFERINQNRRRYQNQFHPNQIHQNWQIHQRHPQRHPQRYNPIAYNYGPRPYAYGRFQRTPPLIGFQRMYGSQQNEEPQQIQYHPPDASQPNPDNMETRVTCPICLQFPKNPNSTNCGHVFCQGCIDTWLLQHNTCPTCVKPVFLTHRIYLG